MQTKDAAVTQTAIPLTVSTQQAGFGTIQMLGSVNVSQRAEQLYEQGRGLPLQYYRVALALLETKLYLYYKKSRLLN